MCVVVEGGGHPPEPVSRHTCPHLRRTSSPPLNLAPTPKLTSQAREAEKAAAAAEREAEEAKAKVFGHVRPITGGWVRVDGVRVAGR